MRVRASVHTRPDTHEIIKIKFQKSIFGLLMFDFLSCRFAVEMIQAITDVVNLLLLDRDLENYINKFDYEK